MKTLIFDLDGTMYRGTQPIEPAVRLIEKLNEKKIPYLFLTNNAMRTPQENAIHMEKMGYNGIGPEQFYNSSMAAADFAARTYPYRRAWFIGQNGLEKALLQAGFELVDQNPEIVFVGMNRHADYNLYSQALGYLLNGAVFIATNSDRLLAKPQGFELGNGSVVKMLEYASGIEAIKTGKPNRAILEACLSHFGLNAHDVVLIGDNLETDVALGYNNQVTTVLVESGVHTRNDIQRLQIFPDHVIGSMDELDLDAFL